MNSTIFKAKIQPKERLERFVKLAYMNHEGRPNEPNFIMISRTSECAGVIGQSAQHVSLALLANPADKYVGKIPRSVMHYMPKLKVHWTDNQETPLAIAEYEGFPAREGHCRADPTGIRHARRKHRGTA